MEECSWKMFRGNAMRTGISSSSLSRRPSLRWIIEFGPMVASPIYDNSIIYAATITGRIFATNVYQKQVKWHSNIGSPIVSSPLLHDGLLISATFDSWIKETAFLGKNLVFGLDTNTGDQVWSIEINGDIFSSPCVAKDMIIIGSMNKNLLAIDSSSGNLKWTFDALGEIWSSPSFNGDAIFVGCDDGFLYSLDLDGRLKWKTRLNGKIRSSSPCLSEDNLIFIGTHNGSIYCLDQFDGVIRWNKQLTKPVLSSAALLKDRVFFASSDKKVYCLDCKTGTKAWEFETSDRIWSSPAIAENDMVLFLGSLDSHIYGLDILTGNQTWKFPTMNIIDSSPCIACNMLFVSGRDGILYVFSPEKDVNMSDKVMS
jgi:eukaryotic-like serine/threonine-protein kinase